MAVEALTSRHLAANTGHMAARTPKPQHPVPDVGELLVGADLWTPLIRSTDRYTSLWENARTLTGATWAVLDGGAYGPVVALTEQVAA